MDLHFKTAKPLPDFNRGPTALNTNWSNWCSMLNDYQPSLAMRILGNVYDKVALK